MIRSRLRALIRYATDADHWRRLAEAAEVDVLDLQSRLDACMVDRVTVEEEARRATAARDAYGQCSDIWERDYHAMALARDEAASRAEVAESALEAVSGYRDALIDANAGYATENERLAPAFALLRSMEGDERAKWAPEYYAWRDAGCPGGEVVTGDGA
jgi:hypothetical protein